MAKDVELSNVWASPFWLDPRNFRSIGYNINIPTAQLEQNRRSGGQIEKSEAPAFLYFKTKGLPEKRKSKLPDLMMITNRLLIFSGKLRRICEEFHLGKSQFFPVDLREFDQKKARDGDWHYFHLCEHRKTFVPEESIGFRPNPYGGNDYSRYANFEDVKLSVRNEDFHDCDIWVDGLLPGWTFFSDRLKSEISSSGCRFSLVKFTQCWTVGNPTL